MNYYGEFLKKFELYGNIRVPEFYEWFVCNMEQIHRDAKHYIPPRIYKYMVTFTIDPKRHEPTDALLQERIEEYIVGLFNKDLYDKFYFVKEHATSNCHWHCVVYTSKALKYDRLTYYKTKYGNVDVSRSHELNDEHTMKYLSKEPGARVQQIR